MKKRYVVLIVLTVLIAVAVVVSAGGMERKEPSVQEQAYEMMDRIEGAIEEMDGDWKKYAVTEVSPLTYEDDKGNTIIYYLCETTFYEMDPAEITGLNLNAVKSVLDPDETDNSRECLVNGLDAMLYDIGERSYLCWSISPEYTCILEYSPEIVTEADIFKMAESVPTDVEQ